MEEYFNAIRERSKHLHEKIAPIIDHVAMLQLEQEWTEQKGLSNIKGRIEESESMREMLSNQINSILGL